MKRLLLWLSLIQIATFSWAPCAWGQPEQVRGGWLPLAFNNFKLIPIYRFGDTVYAATVYDGSASMCFRRPAGGWFLYAQDGNAQYPGFVEYYVSRLRTSYFYNSDTQRLHYRLGSITIPRDCPGRPVIDRFNNVHVIWLGQANAIRYGYSTDTLNTFAFEDTVYSLPFFLRTVKSPNDSLLCAIFYNPDTDVIFKYFSANGEPFDLSEPDEIVACDGIIENAFDIVIDDSGDVAYIGEAWIQYGWDYFFIWSERCGFRPFAPYEDPITLGLNFEIAFGPDPGEMLITESGSPPVGNLNAFYVSLDSGDSWMRSTYGSEIPNGFYGSTTRVYGDTVDFVYFTTDPGNTTFYLPIHRDSIMNHLVAIAEEAPFPTVLMISTYPNPFNARTMIYFSAPANSRALLRIYDISGRLVKKLYDGSANIENSGIIWDGRDEGGRPVVSGLYFARLTAGQYAATKKMVLLK
jgi:hypothetical protein